jgi:hypothetical protein
VHVPCAWNIGKCKMHEYTATPKHRAECPKPIARSTRLHMLAELVPELECINDAMH